MRFAGGARAAFVALASFFAVVQASAGATYYVATNGSDAADGTSWATAKQTIQAAIDLTVSNDTVLVSNGVYATGGRVLVGAMTNRVAISNAIIVRSMNGPLFTTIRGAKDPVTINGDAAVRCVYVGTNATLSGFTLTNGATRTSGETNGGGAWCETSGVLSNCTLIGNSAADGGGAFQGTLNNCTLTRNSASGGGGGAYFGTLNNCVLTRNSATNGGGSFFSTLNNCSVTSNSALSGGGAYQGTLNNCLLTSNSAYSGGGAYEGTLNNCVLTRNSATNGGGAFSSTLNNCVLASNSAFSGGGAYQGALNNCTLARNSASSSGGGAYEGALNNCIVWSNSAPADANHFLGAGSINFSCTTPLPSGTGNISNDPQLVGYATTNLQLSASSPCINAGDNASAPTNATPFDLAGNARIINSTVDMGAYEVQPVLTVLVATGGTATGSGSYPAGSNVVISATGINGHWFFTEWNDGNTNLTRTIVMPVSNVTYTAAFTQYVGAMTFYVRQTGNDAGDGRSWAAAKQRIQAGVDLTLDGDTVLVSNGVYNIGGRAAPGETMTNRVAIDRAITVRSLFGPGFTAIWGGGPVGSAAVRCVYVGTNATLVGFTLTNGATRASGETNGGGAWCEASGILSNCTLAGNAAAGVGGGAFQGSLVNCMLIRNSASNSGGGAYSSALNNSVLVSNTARFGGGSYQGTLNNCTLVGNTATNIGGGAFEGALYNCIVWSNSAPTNANHFLGSGSINFSCTTPDPGAGTGNITNDPQFASLVVTNLRLSATSPCIDTGNDAYAPTNATPFDLSGSLRIITTVDMGAFEAPPVLTVVAIGGTTTGSGIYPVGSNVVISATASNGHWLFTGWHDGDTNLARTIVIPDSNITYTATFTQLVGAITFHVATNGNDLANGTSWATAKRTIQAAVDVALDGDAVLVSNGVYATGGRVVAGTLTNRVAINRSIIVSSLNGPGVTTIRGAGPNGNLAVRCAYVGTNAVLAGFTLTNGATSVAVETNGGGAWCEASGVLSNCILILNSSAGSGGGAYQGTLVNCLLTRNSASNSGGGTLSSTLNNCVLASNSARFGGGSYLGVLNNCTLARNAATNIGGGAYEGALYNCIVWSNSAPTNANHFLGSGSINFSCTIPDPGAGTGNITNDPQFVSLATATNLRLSAASPCIDTGNDAYAPTNATPFDLIGNQRIINTVDMGAYEAPPVLTVVAIGGTTTGSGIYEIGSNVVISATASNGHWLFTGWHDGDTNLARTIVIPDSNITYTATFTQLIGAVTFHVATNGNDLANGTSWAEAKQTIQAAVDVALDGDTVLVSNGVYATGGRTVIPLMTNRVAISNAITVRSVNGPDFTFIRGAGPNGNAAVRCVYVGTNATLVGFTLTNGATRAIHLVNPFAERGGGGAWCESSGVLSNCTLTGNSADVYGGGSFGGKLNNCTLAGNLAINGAAVGGGAYTGVLNNCTLTGNWAFLRGGGASDCTLSNSTLTGNSTAGHGGGAHASVLKNSTMAGNTAAGIGGGAFGSTLSNCTLVANTASNAGGGAGISTLNNCTLTGNSARNGGGSTQGTLNNCTLSGNSAAGSFDFAGDRGGGGSYQGTLNNCTLVGNSSSPYHGGGAHSSVLNNCLLTGNSAGIFGGGAFDGTLNNCVLAYNSALLGGGESDGVLNNCIVWANSAPTAPNCDIGGGSISYSCTAPLPSGTGNIASDPQFVSLATTNLRLTANSPCVNKGNNAYAPTNAMPYDLDGNPRILNGTVDMGAYESFPPSTNYNAWAAAITNGLTNLTDSATGDGYPNLLKYATGSSPTTSDDLARLTATLTNGFFAPRFNRNTNAGDVTLFVELSIATTNGTLWVPIATNIFGSWGGDTNVSETGFGSPVSVRVIDPDGSTNKFFRLRVTLP